MITDETNKGIPRHLTTEEIRNGCIEIYGGDNIEAKLCMIGDEFRQGIDSIEPYKQSVTFYGGTKFKEGNKYYEKARDLASRIVKEIGCTIVTGGGPGIMEAANRGAFEANGKSIGLTIKLPHEQKDNQYLTDSIPFYFFFARKVTLSYMSEVNIFFPGGFGTFDELFGIITLIQTGKIKKTPIILVGKEYWKQLDRFIESEMLKNNQTINPEDKAIYQIIDDEDEILHIVKKAKHIEDNGL